MWGVFHCSEQSRGTQAYISGSTCTFPPCFTDNIHFSDCGGWRVAGGGWRVEGAGCRAQVAWWRVHGETRKERPEPPARKAGFLGHTSRLLFSKSHDGKGANGSKNRPHDAYPVRCRVPGYYEPCSDVCQLKKYRQLKDIPGRSGPSHPRGRQGFARRSSRSDTAPAHSKR